MKNFGIKSALSLLILLTMILSTVSCAFIPGGQNPSGGGTSDTTNPESDEKDQGTTPPNNDDNNTPSDGFDREAELEKYNNRFEAYEGILDDETINQVMRLYSLYDDSVYEWLANLWDDEVGGFYYSNSGRDYESFLPDIESTRQTLAIIRTSGMMDAHGDDVDKAFAKVFPKELADKIVAFVKSCQDPDNGYFYHKQWGKDIGPARLGRDFEQALTLLELFGEEPDYPTILDKASSANLTTLTGRSSTVAATSCVARTSSANPDYMKSKEAFKAYLDSFNFIKDSHSSGHVIASQWAQIQAAGLLDFACDYFDALQKKIYDEQVAAGETPTGLWQYEANYTSISGLYKIGGIYNKAGRCINYLDECINSAIKVIKDTSVATDIVYVFNPWAGMKMAFDSMKRAINKGNKTYDLEASYARVRSELSELVRITVDKLYVFEKASGGFSYYIDYSASSTQGVPVSLGLAEGDVNATNIAVNSIRVHIFLCSGLEIPAMWNFEDFERFVGIMQNLDPIEKIALERGVIDFEDCNEGQLPLGITANQPSGVKIDPLDEYNKVLYLYSPKGTGTKPIITTSLSGAYTCAVVEMDMMLSSIQSGNTHQIKIHGTTGNTYMLTLRMDASKKTVTIGDCSHHTGGIVGDLKITVPADEWFNLRLEIYTSAESDLAKEGFIVKIFVDGEFAAYSNNYFGPAQNYTEVMPSIAGIDLIEMYGMASVESELFVDNLYCNFLLGQTFEEE